jgi:predicted ABC-type ATPase
VSRGRFTPRLRMFAGPNGSGKSTIQLDLARRFSSRFLGVVVNPDDLQAEIARNGKLPLEPFGVNADESEVRQAFTTSAFLKQHNLADAAAVLKCDGHAIDFAGLAMNAYYASVLSDFLRRKLLASRVPFSFETVMSDPGKVAFLKEAQSRGFRTYLYFIATEDPEINISRVSIRVAQGGHDVPKDKIVSRYLRSLELVRNAIRYADRAYFWDTSESESRFVAECAAGERPEMYGDHMPNWFKNYVWDRFP